MNVQQKRPLVELVYFDAGGGHRSAATALQARLAESHPHWDVQLVNLQDILKPVDPLFRLTGKTSETYYNNALKKGWTYGSRGFLRWLQKGIQFFADEMTGELKAYWGKREPAMVVSLIPNFNKLMFKALRHEHPDVPYVTIMTDMADVPPHFWMEKQDQYIICGTSKAVKQAQKLGAYRPERIFQVSGMLLRPAFYQTRAASAKELRQRHGLDAEKPVALIMFGGNGSSLSEKIVRRLNDSKRDVQTIVMCGRDEALRTRLAGRPGCLAVGYTSDVPTYMAMADVFIGKPGPGSISEAVHTGLPVIVERNAATMIQERYNADWVVENGVGVAIKSFKSIADVVADILKPKKLARMRGCAHGMRNDALYEIPDLLQKIMEENRPPCRPQRSHGEVRPEGHVRFLGAPAG